MGTDASKNGAPPSQPHPDLAASGNSGQPPPDNQNLKEPLVLALGALGVV